MLVRFLFNEDQCAPRAILYVRAFEDLRTPTNDGVESKEVKQASINANSAAQQQQQQNPQTAKELEEWAAKGDAESQCRLALYLLNGTGGFQKDAKRAVKLLEQSAAKGFARAQANLGNLYAYGHGVEKVIGFLGSLCSLY
jgi:TPR repeat protein